MKGPSYKGSAIYVIKNIVNEKCYVGSAYNFNNRKYMHDWKLRKNIHSNRILQHFVNKYGIDSVYIEILEKVDDIIEIIKREQWWIDNNNSEFNICKIAGTDYHIERKRKESTRELLRQAGKGRIYTAETRKRMSETRTRLAKEGQRNSKIPMNRIPEVKKLIAYNTPLKEIAAMFGVGITTISEIKAGRCWVDIPNYIVPDNEKHLIKRTNQYSRLRKVTEEQRLEIIKRVLTGETYKRVSEDYPITKEAVSAIMRSYRKFGK